MGTWSFRERKVGNYARTCRHARARAAAGGGGGRPAGAGDGAGPGPGSLPGLVLFESGLAGMGCSAPLPKPPARQRMSENRLGSWTVGRLDRTVATVLSEPSQLLKSGGREAPPGAL